MGSCGVFYVHKKLFTLILMGKYEGKQNIRKLPDENYQKNVKIFQSEELTYNEYT